MTDFEIQRRLRELGGPRAPQRDLWPGIVARIVLTDAAPAGTVAHRRRRWPLVAAAGVALVLAAGILLVAQRQLIESKLASAPAANAPSSSPVTVAPNDRSGDDPRLAGAAIVLDAAHHELEQALEQRPDAVFLVGLLNRTNEQRMKLQRLGMKAG